MRHHVLPDAEHLVGELRANPELDYTRLGEKYGVSRQAVSQRIRKAGVIPPKPQPVSLKAYVPWRVLAKHDSHYHLRMLRLFARREMGLPLPEQRQRQMEEWEQAMRHLKLVVTYDRDTVAGFSVADWRPGDKELWRP